MSGIERPKFIVRLLRGKAVVAAALAVLSLPATGRAGATYTVTALMSGNSYAFGINNAGAVVGEYKSDSGFHAFLHSGGAISYLPFSSNSQGPATAINDSGAIVGWVDNRAFLYENGVVAKMGVDSYAYGLNNSGNGVGQARTSSGQVHAFLYTKSNNKVTDLGTLGGDYSVGFGINDANQVVGVSRDSGGLYRAFLYEGGVMKDLGTLIPGGESGNAQSINNSGAIVGTATSTAAGDSHAFLYSGGVMKDLGTLGGSYSIATAINDSGEIVGYSYLQSPGEEHAFLYRNGAMIDLNSLIDPTSGWTISNASDINDSGQIVGHGYLPGTGYYQAVLLTPIAVPEPSGLVLLATGTACLGLAVRRRSRNRFAN